jgi:hypothetical protein
MATKDRLLRLEKRLAIGEEKKKTCNLSFDWPNDDGTFEHVEIHVIPAVFEQYCRNAEKIYGEEASRAREALLANVEPEDSPG